MKGLATHFFLAGKKVHEAGIESESSEGVY